MTQQSFCVICTPTCFDTLCQVSKHVGVYLMCVCPCLVVILGEENQLDATQWFIEPVICSTCFGHLYAHHQELETILLVATCGV
jgi:hypothetical protein